MEDMKAESGFDDLVEVSDRDSVVGEADGRSRGVQSVEVGMRLLLVLARARGPVSLRDLSQKADMAPAKVHRYLASLVETGMVVRRTSGAYDLGMAASEIGLAAIRRFDVVNYAIDNLPALVEHVDANGMLSVWTPSGPMVVRWERARKPISATVGVGSLLPVLTTATGRAFMSKLPERIVLDVIRRQIPHGPLDLEALRKQNTDGTIFWADETFLPSTFAIARPMMDQHDGPAAAVALISNERSLLSPEGAGYKALVEFTSFNMR